MPRLASEEELATRGTKSISRSAHRPVKVASERFKTEPLACCTNGLPKAARHAFASMLAPQGKGYIVRYGVHACGRVRNSICLSCTCAIDSRGIKYILEVRSSDHTASVAHGGSGRSRALVIAAAAILSTFAQLMRRFAAAANAATTS
ncbi:hypothetical protein MRX96_030832 [Rhipicephalus microplus]